MIDLVILMVIETQNRGRRRSGRSGRRLSGRSGRRQSEAVVVEVVEVVRGGAGRGGVVVVSLWSK